MKRKLPPEPRPPVWKDLFDRQTLAAAPAAAFTLTLQDGGAHAPSDALLQCNLPAHAPVFGETVCKPKPSK